MKIRLSHPGPLRKVALAAFLALALPVVVIAVAPTLGFGLVVLTDVVAQQLGSRP